MDSLTDLMATIARVRRAMPRNADVMAVCDALEARISKTEVPVEVKEFVAAVATKAAAAKFDKRAYQRDLMRKRRAEGKA